MQVIYVCTGNICRSAFAERLSSHLLPQVSFSSAGIGALVGAPMDELMADELRARGGSADDYAAQQLMLPQLAAVDVVVAMDRGHRAWVLEEAPGMLRRVLLLGQLQRAAEQLDPGIRGAEFLNRVPAATGRPSREDEVPDPYRQGPKAAAECAERIAGALDLVLPRLA